jgi:hypothetical protein
MWGSVENGMEGVEKQWARQRGERATKKGQSNNGEEKIEKTRKERGQGLSPGRAPVGSNPTPDKGLKGLTEKKGKKYDETGRKTPQ